MKMPTFTPSGTFKIFVGKISQNTTAKDLRPLFEKYGRVLQCDVVKNYGFVHMEKEAEGIEAIKNLNDSVLHGAVIKVEAAKSRKSSSSPTIKIFVGNLPNATESTELRELFNKYGTVIECDLVQNYAFVHIDTTDVTSLLNDLNGYSFHGQPLKVQISTSRIRQRPGMGDPQLCYKCGRSGHWSKECSRGVPHGAMGTYSESISTSLTHPLYSRNIYPSSFLRDRVLPYSALPDPRDVYDRYLDHSISSRYDEYAALATRRDLSSRIPTFSDDDIFSRRSPTSSRYAPAYDEYARRSAAAAGSYDHLDGRRNRSYDDSLDRRGAARLASRYMPY